MRTQGKPPRIVVQEKVLTVFLARDGEHICAYCPELDIVTEMPTAELALQDMMEAIREYAEEYMRDFEIYAKSPNRAHHLPYVEAVLACKTDWDLMMLI